MSMEFFKSLTRKPVIKETRSYEDMLLAQLEKKADKIAENADKKDHISFDVPLLIRVFELIREGAHTDVEVHQIVERLINIKNRGVLTMDDYNDIAGDNMNGRVPEKDMDEADDIEHGYPSMPKEDIDISSLRALAGIGK